MCKIVRDLLRSKKGHILFASLPICYGKQIGEVLCESEVIQMMFAPIDFGIPSGLEFFDSNREATSPPRTLTAWARWVQNSENLIGPTTIRRMKKRG